MPGRRLCSDIEASARGFRSEDCAQRRRVLRETLAAFEQSSPRDHFQVLALQNLRRWSEESGGRFSTSKIQVVEGDWGDVTLAMTRKHGACFAVLNMANAYCPGGGYVEGAVAQEENMYRRTDCHFYIGEEEYDSALDRYRPETTRLLSAIDGAVYLDTSNVRVCIRGAENRTRKDLGYRWLVDDEVFPFFELRAAAQDLRDGSDFDASDARRRIAAQLDTLKNKGVRHVIFGAHGCGAFQNPAERVAELYREEIAVRAEAFDSIVFAIFPAGYGPDNYTPFVSVFNPGRAVP